MRILWSVNTIFPYPAKKLNISSVVLGGSWLISLLDNLKNNDKISNIAIVAVYKGNEFFKFVNNKEIYYLIPSKNIYKYSNLTKEFMEKIIDEFKPDLVHIHGVEYPHSLAVLNACKNKNIKNCVSIQGLVSKCGQKDIYNAGISTFEMLKNTTIRDIIRLDFLPLQYKKYLQRAKYEIEVLKKCDYIIGRTNWDKINANLISNKDNYFHNNENLRNIFYLNKWNLKKMIPHSIYFSQATYPLKGFHKLIMAASILKKEFPDLKIWIAGVDITKSKANFYNRLKINGYGKYIKKMIKKFKLVDNIEFVGYLDEDRICEYLLKSNVFVQSSSLENSSNSLGEAMMIGTPCIASFVGGTNSLLDHNKEGLLYPFNDVELLIEYIREIFNDSNLAIKLSDAAHKRALLTHNREKNIKELIEIYDTILKNN